MYQVDFLPVESESGEGSKSGDAITAQFSVAGRPTPAVMVVDAGYGPVGKDVVEHITNYYDTDVVDLMISTHPDADHLNGLTPVIESLDVRELLIHQPRLHRSDVDDFSNLERLDEVLERARSRGVTVTEPYTGTTRFGGTVRILGPTLPYYEELLDEQLAEERTGTAALRRSASLTAGLAKYAAIQQLALSFMPEETLDDFGVTGPRNRSSVITLLQVDGQRLLLTGDAGIESLERAADEYEAVIGRFSVAPLTLLQAPHHGSRRNLGPTILNRMLGSPGNSWAPSVSVISSAAADPKHPSPRVTNALRRRDCTPTATEGRILLESNTTRPGWSPAAPVPILPEEED